MKIAILVFAILGIAGSATLPKTVPPPRAAYLPTVGEPLYPAQQGLKITNGQEAFPHSIPYQAYLIGHGHFQSWSCGGILITPHFVLTSANCVVDALDVEVHLGRHHLQQPELGSVEINSRRVMLHEEFNPQIFGHDIALVELDGEVFPTETINFAQVAINQQPQPGPGPQPGPDDDLVGQLGRISGWGVANSQAPVGSDVLLEAIELIVPNEACNQIYGNIIRPDQLCLSGAQGRVACRGDTGGPLTVNDFVEGVISFGTQDCNSQFPTVTAKLRDYTQWLETHSDWQPQPGPPGPGF